MEFVLFIKGLLTGLAAAAPFGPIGILCVRRTFAHGRAHGLASGLGGALADALYGFIAGSGMVFVSNFLVSHEGFLRPLFGLMLCAFGIRAFLAKPVVRSSSDNGIDLLHAFTSVFFLTMTNPATILVMAFLFVGLGVAQANMSIFHTGFLVLGVFTGSALWWIILSGIMTVFHIRLNEYGLILVNRITGAMLIIIGLLVILGLWKGEHTTLSPANPNAQSLSAPRQAAPDAKKH